MSKQREAMELALEALQWNWGGEPLPTMEIEAIEALKSALAEPEPWTPDDMAHRPGGLSMNTEQGINPSPIGFWNGKETAYFEHELVDGCLPIGDCTMPLYAYPPTRKPLTDEQLRTLARDAGIKLMNDEALALGYLPAAIKKFAKAIERAHGIGE